MEANEDILMLNDASRTFHACLKVIGVILMLYFALNMIEKAVVAVDLAGQSRGVTVTVGEKTVSVPVLAKNEDGGYVVVEQEVTDSETITLHGPSAWSAYYAVWLSANAIYLFIGAVLYGAGFLMTPKRKDRLSATLFKQKLLGMGLALVSVLIMVNGINRVFFLPHEPLRGFLYNVDWYVVEFLAQTVWGLAIAVMAAFFLIAGRYVSVESVVHTDDAES